jgi:hypothetical protein
MHNHRPGAVMLADASAISVIHKAYVHAIFGRAKRTGFFGCASGVKFRPRNLDRVPCNEIGRYIASDTCING